MRYSIRLLPRERIALLNMRLDPLLTTRAFADIVGVNELLEGLIFFSDQELRNNSALGEEIRKYFAYKKNMPLRQMNNKNIPIEKREAPDSKIILDEEIFGKDMIEGYLPPYNPVDMDSHTTGWLGSVIDDRVESILLNIFQANDVNEVKISNGELLRGLIHFLVNDINFQIAFREIMFIGSLYGLKYNETGALIDGIFSGIEENTFLSFRDNFLADYENWINLLNGRENGVITSKTNEFIINRAIDRYVVLWMMAKIYDYNASYLTYFEISLDLVKKRENKKFVSYAKLVLEADLLKFKIAVDRTMFD